MDTQRKLVAAGGVVGLMLAGGMIGASLLGTADAATPSPSPSAGAAASASTATEDPNPGDDGADGVPESQEVHGDHHGGHHGDHGGHGGGALDLSGTVTAVGTSSVTIKTSTATTKYTVAADSDIDKSGEAALKDLVAGDAVTFSVDDADATVIDKLHAGDEAKDAPSGSGPSASTASPSSSDT